MSRRSGAGGRICLLASVVQLVAAPVFASPGVLVFPRTPEAERYVAEAEQAVAKAGFGRVAFAPVAAQLSAAAERERERTRAALSEIERGLASVRQAYLEQRYAAMLTGLTDLESRALAVLARPEQVATLWELEFQIGLAHAARRAAGERDSGERYALCLNLQPERRPPREMYGPAVTDAFLRASITRSRQTPEPIAIRTQPADARVIVDGLPLLSPKRVSALVPGLHVVRASAPGFADSAAVVRSGREPLAVTLRPLASPDPIVRMGASWAAGELGDDVSSRQLIWELAQSAGAAAVLILEAEHQAGSFTAQILVQDQVTEPVARRAAADATAAALVRLSPQGRLMPAAPLPPLEPAPVGPKSPSLWTRWWFWTVIGVAIAGATSAGIVLASDTTDHLRVWAP